MFWSPDSADDAPVTSVQLLLTLVEHDLDSGSLSPSVALIYP